MKKTHPPLPPLSVQALHDVEVIDQAVQDALEGCINAVRKLANPEKASRILRTCLVESLNVQIDYYSSLPNYHPIWIAHITKRTVDSMIGLFPVFTSGEQFRGELLRTAVEHLAQKLKEARVVKKPERIDRIKLRNEYLARFSGEVRILDICWAAGQHYREWKRWLKRELKDGSTPDLAFRRVLASEKRPEEFKQKPRPKGWQ